MSTTRGQHLIGKVIGSCMLERLLGYGGTSAVFLGQQLESGQKVAVKVFLPRTRINAQMQRDFYLRFLQEAESASKLDHPNILPIYSYGEQDGLPFIIMPYMEGGTLSEYAARQGCLLLSEAQWYLAQLAVALDYAHEQGCVHCDVKPANILLDSDGQAMLSDFGIARLVQPMGENEDALHPVTKAPETLMGTPDYISPEQALALPLDGRSDIYSLGVTLFYVLAGRLPFKADSTIAVALLHVHEPPPLLALLRADISPQIDAVIQKALAKKPEDRFQSAREFSAAFDAAIAASTFIYQSGVDHNRAKQLLTQAGGGRSDKRSAVISSPVVQVKPLRQGSIRFPPIFIALAIVLMIVVGTAATAGVVASRLAANSPIIQSTGPASNIPLDDLADSSDWPTDGGHMFFFSDEQYYIQNTSGQFVALALYADHSYHNFQLTVTMSEIKGSRNGADYYGIVFRSSAIQSSYYLFEMVAWGGGQYQFLRYNGHYTTLAGGPAPGLNIGIGKSNTVTIEAQGNTFRFLINGKSVGSSATDTSSHALSSGEIGLYVEEQGTEVAFSHLYVKTVV
ncbi:MAG TPA: protein kinase [Ktedonobacteraceae bacterium]|nr:protein kinase [Ktedonobacteraceae bacterium]